MTAFIDRLTSDPALGVPVLLALIVVLLVAALVPGRPKANRLDDRLKSLHTTAYGDLSGVEASLAASQLDDEEVVKTPAQRLVAKLAEIIAPLPLVGKKEQAKIEQHLTRAGFRSHMGVPLFMLVKLAFAIAFAIGAIVFFIAKPDLDVPFFGKLLITAAAAMIGGVMSEKALKRYGLARGKRIARALPDAMDLMVICAEAGLSLEVALDRVAQEMRLAGPELSDEFSTTVAELQLLPDRRQGLINLAKRTDLEMLRGVVTTLIQAQKYGTPLAQSMRVLGAEMRTARMLQVEEKAARMPALISIPLICLVLPAMFLIIGGPAILEVNRVFSGG